MLIGWRALHFAATLQIAGALVFATYADEAAARGAHLRVILWASLVLTILSGLGWLFAVAATLGNETWPKALADGTIANVLGATQFGTAWLIRGTAAGVLTVLLAIQPGCRSLILPKLVAASILVGGLAFAGHAATLTGVRGVVHVAADIVHLTAAAVWLGGLLPYALALQFLRRESEQALDQARSLTRRFSNVGVFAVIAIVATGIINTLHLVGSWDLFAESQYGRLLAAKLLLVGVMVAIAAFNRFVFLSGKSKFDAIEAIRRNALIEFALGGVVLALVAGIGTLPPALP